jgi:hypothetical protein
MTGCPTRFAALHRGRSLRAGQNRLVRLPQRVGAGHRPIVSLRPFHHAENGKADWDMRTKSPAR